MSLQSCAQLAGFRDYFGISSQRNPVAIKHFSLRPWHFSHACSVCRVNNGIPLAEAIFRHDAWLCERGFLAPTCRCLPITWSEWDLKVRRKAVRSQGCLHACRTPTSLQLPDCCWRCLCGCAKAFAWVPSTQPSHQGNALQIQLESECKWRQIAIPAYLRRWHDLRTSCKQGKVMR